MVKYAARGLKIGVQSRFDPKFDVGIRTFFTENFGQAYCPCISEVPEATYEVRFRVLEGHFKSTQKGSETEQRE